MSPRPYLLRLKLFCDPTCAYRIHQVPIEGQKLVEKLNEQGKNLEALVTEKKLFVVSYDALAPCNRYRKQGHGKTFLLPLPVVLLDLRDGDDGPTLMPLGVQLDMATTNSLAIKDNDPVVLPQSRAQDWASAIACVLTADSSVHEWLSHLGRTHLTMEPHILAVNNRLRQHNHRVFQFLEPHLRDTLFALARLYLAPADQLQRDMFEEWAGHVKNGCQR